MQTTRTVAIQTRNVQEKAHLDRKSLKEVSQKVQHGVLTMGDANTFLIELVADYTHPDGKRQTLNQFIEKTVGIVDFSIEKVNKEIGWSGNKIYWVRSNSSNEILLFLKTFQKDEKKFFPEMFGLSFLRKVPSVSAPKVKAFGQCHIGDQQYFLVLETKVPGQSIQSYYNDVSKYLEGSFERKECFLKLCQAVQACGEGLSCLHSHRKGEKQPLSLHLKDMMNETLNKAISELQLNPQEGIEIQKLQKHVECVIQRMESENHQTGVTHDDVKLVHTFYDEFSHKFSLIGPHSLVYSLDKENLVQGMPVKDYYQFVISLILNRFGYCLDTDKSVQKQELLTEDEVQKVIEFFKLGYEKTGGILPTPIEEDFLLLRHDLFFVSNMRRVLPEPDMTRLKDLISISLNNLKARCL